MDIITMARELGRAIQQDDRYTAYMLTAQANEDNETLKAKIALFNELRVKVNAEVQKSDKDAEKLAEMDKEFKALYKEIVEMPEMIAFNAAKKELDGAINFVNQIISGACDGENPDEIEEASSCGGSCSSCSGCH